MLLTVSNNVFEFNNVISNVNYSSVYRTTLFYNVLFFFDIPVHKIIYFRLTKILF